MPGLLSFLGGGTTLQGWIQLHRKLLKNDMWQEFNAVQKEITVTILLMASYREKRWEYGGETYEVKPGQFVTSLDGIMKNCSKDVTESKLRTTLKKLKAWGFLSWEPKGRARLITITNWENYQAVAKEEEERESEPVPEPQPASETKPKKKDGKEPPERKSLSKYDTEFEELWQEYPRKEGKAQALKAYRRHRKAGKTMDDFRTALERYKRKIRREGTEKRFIMQGKRFFNTDFEDYMGDDTGDGDMVQVEPQRLEMPGMDFLQQQLEKAMENL